MLTALGVGRGPGGLDLGPRQGGDEASKTRDKKRSTFVRSSIGLPAGVGVHAGTPLPAGSNERRKYRIPSLPTGQTFQDPQRTPETIDSAEPPMSYTMFFLCIRPYDKV